MKPMLLVSLVCFAHLAFAADPVDAFMGDWKGTITPSGLAGQTVALQMIPQGQGRYEARILSRIDERVPVLHHLRGLVTDGQVRLIDALPFDVSRVIRATDDGVVYQASLWSGSGAPDALQGRMAGALKGGFQFEPAPRTSPTLGIKPPPGAVVLFDGTSLDPWTKRDPRGEPAPWRLVGDGSMEVQGGDIITREKFGSFHLHLEFRTPYMPQARGQGRGNSGVYLQGRYEVQVLDSFGLSGEDNDCGGLYQIARPRVNMCFPPLQWQTYDITFTAPERGPAGKKTANGRVTILHNGVLIHDNLELPRITGGAVNDREGEPEGILLQDHGDPVRYRNIWIQHR
jgi:hypothetical protein